MISINVIGDMISGSYGNTPFDRDWETTFNSFSTSLLSMVDKLKDKKPYHSIYGFTRVDNTEAQLFYDALGFNIEHVNGLYKDGQCKLFWASYDELYDKYFGDNK